jgi:hypothetical protein
MNTGEGERVERRLTAILATDAVTYSKLMGEDEASHRRCASVQWPPPL